MKKLVDIFAPLTAEQIRSTRLDQYDDYDLFDILDHFLESEDETSDDCAAALLELILHSHDCSDMVDYDDLYSEITEIAYRAQDWPALLKWAYARLAFDEQHNQSNKRALIWSQLAGAYGDAGDLDAHLTLYARCLEAGPNALDIFASATYSLANLGHRDLALEVAARVVQQAQSAGDDEAVAYYQEVYDELAAEDVDAAKQPAPVGEGVFAAFRRALDADQEAAAAMGYAPPIDRLLAPTGPDDALLHAEILAQGKVLAGDLIRLAFDLAFDQTPASRAAIDLLRQLHRRQTVPLDELAHFLEHADGDWRPLLSKSFGKFGPYPLDEIEAVALDVATARFIRSEAIGALRERAEKVPAERQRVVAIFRTLLTRPEAIDLPDEETVVADVISEAVDLKATELYPEIEQAYREDRVDLQIIGLTSVQEEWGLPLSPEPPRREDGFYLPLQCQKCSRIRDHFVQHVFLDLETAAKMARGENPKYDPYVMDREIVCPKCGARDRYRLSPMAVMRLHMPESDEDLIKMLSGHPHEANIRPNPRLKSAKATAFSQIMHPLEALERYKMLILTHPKRAENHIRMGKVLRTLYRTAPALAAIRKGHDLEPDNLDWTIERALAEHDLGDKDLALKLYDKVLRLASGSITQNDLMLEASAVARQGKHALRKGQPSPWHEMTFGYPERPTKP